MEEKDEDLIRKFINGGFTEKGVDAVYAQSATLYAIKQLQDEIDRYSTPSSHSFDDSLNDTVLTKDVIDGLIEKINASGTNVSYTPHSTDSYILTKDGAYFVYWVMMNYDFILDKGFEPETHIPHRALLSGGGWARHIIKSGVYNEIDREFLNHLKDWLKQNNWVYKKPELNEHHDLYERIESLLPL